MWGTGPALPRASISRCAAPLNQSEKYCMFILRVVHRASDLGAMEKIVNCYASWIDKNDIVGYRMLARRRGSRFTVFEVEVENTAKAGKICEFLSLTGGWVAPARAG